MGTLSKSIKKIKSIEEELFAMRLQLDLLRVKLKNNPEDCVRANYTKNIANCNGFVDSNGVFHIEDIIQKPNIIDEIIIKVKNRKYYDKINKIIWRNI